MVLEAGEIRQIGRPSEIVDSPANPFVAKFLSDAALVPGVLDSHGFHADDLPLMVPRARLSGELPAAESALPGQLAVTPAHVSFTESESPRAAGVHGELEQPAEGAEVISSLYGRHAHSVEADWCGRRLRGETRTWQPQPGARVGVDVVGGFFFAR
ncbi:hypothetical protein [Nesterenkonia flava]|uniref:hypothetical protein n=1 Tax=Nesterenkonia flava TaxID=469799 RepID=UPI0031E1EBFF